MTLGEAIKEKRIALSMTQHDLGQAAGYGDSARATISRIESGKRLPSLSSLLSIARALDTRPSTLLEEAGL